MKPRRINPWSHPAGQSYFIIGVAAAGVLGLSLMERVSGLWAVMPALVAAAGLLFVWTNAPTFVLLGIAVALLSGQSSFLTRDLIADSVFAAAIVAYVMAHYRLVSLMHSVFPTDPRRTLGAGKPSTKTSREILMAILVVPYLIQLWNRKPTEKTRKSARMPEARRVIEVSADEITKALIAVACFAASAVGLYVLTSEWEPPLRIIREQWQLGLIVWAITALAFLVWSAVSYLAARQWTPDEARLILEEEFWRQTRREQRGLGRWVAWSRRKRESKGGAK